MPPPTPASLKKVTPDNLEALGVGSLAAMLADLAQRQPDLKRRLRMELAALQGPEALALEIDKRINSHETSRSRVSWRRRSGFVADLGVLLGLIVDRLGALYRRMAVDRLWRFIDVARKLGLRMRDRDGELDGVFAKAAADLGALLQPDDPADPLAAALLSDTAGWQGWLPGLVETAPKTILEQALAKLRDREAGGPAIASVVRRLADAVGDIDAFAATFSPDALAKPAIAAEIAKRLLEAGRIPEAGRLLEGARSHTKSLIGRAPKPIDFDWETVWIDYLDRSGRADEAQRARWASFERTLSPERARDFTRRLADFDDVEAEQRAFAYASGHADGAAGIRFLMGWPALSEAARMIERRGEDITLPEAEAEAWAAKLRARYPQAAHRLLRRAAAAALRRRDFAASHRLTQDADALDVG